MPSRMSCSLTTSSVTPARSCSSRGQHVDDQRAAADHVDPAGVDRAVAARSARRMPSSSSATRCRSARESRDRCTASGSYSGRPLRHRGQRGDRARDADPGAHALHRHGGEGVVEDARWPRSRASATSSAVGGSPGRQRSVIRTLPTSTDAGRAHRRAAVLERADDQLGGAAADVDHDERAVGGVELADRAGEREAAPPRRRRSPRPRRPGCRGPCRRSPRGCARRGWRWWRPSARARRPCGAGSPRSRRGRPGCGSSASGASSPVASTPWPSRTMRISRCTSRRSRAPSARSTSATSRRIEFVPQSMAATRDMRAPRLLGSHRYVRRRHRTRARSAADRALAPLPSVRGRSAGAPVGTGGRRPARSDRLRPRCPARRRDRRMRPEMRRPQGDLAAAATPSPRPRHHGRRAGVAPGRAAAAAGRPPHPPRREPAPAAGRLRPAGLRPRPGRRGRAGGRGGGAAAPAPAGRARRLGRGARARPAGRRPPAGAAHPRPLRPPHRRGRVPPVVALADAHRGRLGTARHAVGGRAGHRGARRPGGRVLPDGPARVRARLPDLDDLRRRARAAPRPRARRAPTNPACGPRSTSSGCAEPATKAGPARRHVDDREAGRLRRARGHHDGHAHRRRQLPARRAQVVHLGADERPLPHAGAGPGRARPASCCPGCCPTARRNAIRLQRLKDKLGNRSNASAEIEYAGATGLAARRRGPRRRRRSSRWSR